MATILSKLPPEKVIDGSRTVRPEDATPEPSAAKYDPWAGRLIAAVLDSPPAARVIRATAYLSPTLTIKATKQHLVYNRQTNTVLVTIGRPNFAERKFIKACKAAFEPFPVKKLQLKLKPKPKKRPRTPELREYDRVRRTEYNHKRKALAATKR